MVTTQELQKIHEILNKHAKMLVGILLTRVELIEKISKDKPASKLIKLYPDLFKNLSRELVYENNRLLKNKLNLSFIPTVVYRGK